ncbi:MAG: terminase gpA endonuclease subunit [Desulfobacterales bacterium]
MIGIPGGLKSLVVNTKFFKDRLSHLLEVKPGDPSAFHLEADFTEADALHYTSEFVNEKDLWECPDHKPNHLWDCEVFSRVAHEVMGVVHWAKPEDMPQPESSRENKEHQSPRADYRRPVWLDRR